MTRRAGIAAQLKSICAAEGVEWRPEASLLFDVFGQMIEDSMGFSTLVWAVVFSTDTSKYDANDGSNLMSGKILCAELWLSEDSPCTFRIQHLADNWI